MLRYAEDAPAAQAEFPVHLTITFSIADNLGLPEFLVSLGCPIALGTSVPETAVHKDDQPLFLKREVWLAGKFQMPPPSRDFSLLEKFNQNTLSLFISLSVDPGHYLGTFGFGDNVDHKFRRV